MTQGALDGVAEGQAQDAGSGLLVRNTAKDWILRRGGRVRGGVRRTGGALERSRSELRRRASKATVAELPPSHAIRAVILQIARDAIISSASSLEPGRDLHDFDVFADRALASDIYHAGRQFRPLRPPPSAAIGPEIPVSPSFPVSH